MELKDFKRGLKQTGFDDRQAEGLAMLLVAIVNGRSRLDTQRIIAHLWTMAAVICFGVYLMLDKFAAICG